MKLGRFRSTFLTPSIKPDQSLIRAQIQKSKFKIQKSPASSASSASCSWAICERDIESVIPDEIDGPVRDDYADKADEPSIVIAWQPGMHADNSSDLPNNLEVFCCASRDHDRIVVLARKFCRPAIDRNALNG